MGELLCWRIRGSFENGGRRKTQSDFLSFGFSGSLLEGSHLLGRNWNWDWDWDWDWDWV